MMIWLLLVLFSFCPIAQAADLSAVNNALDQIETAKDPFAMYLSEGDGFFAAKDFEQALVSYRKASELKPDQSAVYQKMGDCSAFLGRFHEALVFAQRAVEVDPGNGRLYLDLVMSYVAVKRFDDAKAALEHARLILTSKDDLADLAYVEQGLNGH